MSCGVGHRCSSDPTLLWPWRRLAATAPIGPLAWEPQYVALKKKDKKKKLQKLSQNVGVPVMAQRKQI